LNNKMTLEGKTDADKLKSLSQQPYKNQCVWFLNAFWTEFGEKESEKIWSYVEKIAKIDLQKGAEGNEVDEMQMHRFLETFSETMTVREMRDTLRSKGAISDSVKLVAIIHYLIFRYNVDFHVLVNASQGDNQKEIQEAQRKLDAVSEALQESERKAEQAKKALADSKARESESKAKAAESKVKEEEAHIAKQELEAALKELKEQEDTFNNKTADLQKKSAEGSVVSQNKAKNELAQHLASDPLPLRKAKITQEAAVKKAERATKSAADARVAAEAAVVAAGKAREASEQATRDADAAVDAMQVKMDEAEAFLRAVKAKPGKAMGSIWWMERELHEKKKFMPERKGGIKK